MSTTSTLRTIQKGYRRLRAEKIGTFLLLSTLFFLSLLSPGFRARITNFPIEIKRCYLTNPIQPNATYQYDVAIATIFQNEAPYLKEWIEFHKRVGVQHFYLYNHFSTDDYMSVLDPYLSAGDVELIQWPYKQTSLEHWTQIQCRAYEHALKLAEGNAKWLAILDSDEFLFPTSGDNLGDFLKDYEAFGGIGVNWQLFGTSGISKIPANKLLIETLLLKAPEQFGENSNMKSIVRPETVAGCHSPHFVIYKFKYFQVNANKERFSGPFPPYIDVEKIRINHYWSRDEHFFYATKVDRRAGFNEAANQAIARVQKLNAVHDDLILRFLPDLKGVK